jgi:hypothetical protein
MFPSVTNLYVYEKYVPHSEFAFQEIAGEIEVLPTLENLFLEGYVPWQPLQDAMGDFIVSR